MTRYRDVAERWPLSKRLAELAERVKTAEERAAGWADGTVEPPAASLDPKVSGGDRSTRPERHVAANVALSKPDARGSRVWTSRARPWTDRAHRDLTAAVAVVERVAKRILAQPNPDALGRQSQLVECANRHCTATLDPAAGDIHTAGRCKPCAEHRRAHDRDRTVAEIRAAKGNRTAGPCDHPDCDHHAAGDDDDKLRPHPTRDGVRLCTRHWWQAKRQGAT